MSYTVYESEYKGHIAASQKLSTIPLEDPVELWDVKIKSNSDRVRELGVFSGVSSPSCYHDRQPEFPDEHAYCAGSSL